MSDRLISVRAKIKRAKHHILDLEGRIKAFRETDPYKLICEQDPQTSEYVYTVQTRCALPLDFSLIVGEAIHQLRSALDHLACRLIEAAGGTPSDTLYFPICKSAAIYKARVAGEIKGVKPGAIDVLNAIKPYKGGNNVLWALHKLNNIDKHNLLLVVAYGLRPAFFSEYRTTDPFLLSILETKEVQEFIANNCVRPTVSFPNKRLWILEGNTELLRIFIPDGPPLHMNHKLDFAYDIALGEPEVGEGQAVLPFLHQLCDLVKSIVDLFVPFL